MRSLVASSWWMSSPPTSRRCSTYSPRRPRCTAAAWLGTGPMPAGCGQFLCVRLSHLSSVDFKFHIIQSIIVIMTNLAIYHESLLYRVSTDGRLQVWVNFEDHLRVVTSRADGNISEAFIRLCSSLEKVYYACDHCVKYIYGPLNFI